jgi:precorrin-2 dehydrogenase/sirohydrochlorin ferrochelatase
MMAEVPNAAGELAALLVIAATDSPEVNAQVAKDARARGILACRADEASEGDFIVPGQVRRGTLLIDISTSGAAPSLAAVLRDGLEAQYGPEWEPILRLFGNLRRELRSLAGEDQRRKAVAAILANSEIMRLIENSDLAGAEARARECLSSLSA